MIKGLFRTSEFPLLCSEAHPQTRQADIASGGILSLRIHSASQRQGELGALGNRTRLFLLLSLGAKSSILVSLGTLILQGHVTLHVFFICVARCCHQNYGTTFFSNS